MESEKICAASFIAEIVIGKQAFSFCGLCSFLYLMQFVRW